MFNPRARSRPNTFLAFLFVACLSLSSIARATPSITLSRKSGPPTSKILVSGRGFGPNVGVDIFFGTKDKALVVTDGKGEFRDAGIRAPRSARPGKHWVTALERNNDKGDQQPFLVQTNWPQLGFDANRTGYNPFENVLSPVNVGNLSLRWSYSEDQPVWSYTDAAVVDNGVVYYGYGISSYELDALHASTGALLWKYPGSAPFPYTSAVADGSIYAYSNYVLYALNASTGVQLWQYDTCVNGVCSSTLLSPVVVNGVVYVNMGDGPYFAIYALDGADGTLLWKWDNSTSGALYPPAVGDGMVYTCSSDHNVYALNASTGALVWSYSTTDWVASGPVLSGGAAYVAANDGTVYALNEESGALLWKNVIGYPVGENPAVVEGVLYVAGADLVYALDASTGALIWKQDAGGSNAGLSVANGVVYGGSSRVSNFYALDAGTGEPLWEYALPDGDSLIAPPTIANGIAYFTGFYDSLYAFSLKRGGTSEATDSAGRPNLKALHPNLELTPAKRDSSNADPKHN
jgi:outer membrane protein assembly factor BamB